MLDYYARYNVRDGFNFPNESQSLVGHLLTFELSKTTLAKDFSVTEPTRLDRDDRAIDVAAVLAMLLYQPALPSISLACHVSARNRASILALQDHIESQRVEVQWRMNIYDYDPRGHFYLFDSTLGRLSGTVNSVAGRLDWEIGNVADTTVPMPKNYTFYLSITPDADSVALLNDSLNNS